MIYLAAGLLLVIFIVILLVVFKMSSQVNDRLNAMNQSLQEANKVIGQNLGASTGVFGNVQEQLGRLEETNRQICEISKDISGLQDLLKVPKLRGQIGETLLEGLLSQVLPGGYYQTQYRFKSSETVDAVIKLANRLVPIDAKFSLENFQKFSQSQEEQEKNLYRRKFTQDVKNRIDEISEKYILPQEGTFDFALMYIPAENVYYEVIIKQDLFSYCMAKKVIPVSPNTFYAYLQVICLGLRGLKIEENAKEILENLSMLSNEINRFKEEFSLLGTHLTNANRKYEDSLKRLDKFSNKLEGIQDKRAIESNQT